MSHEQERGSGYGGYESTFNTEAAFGFLYRNAGAIEAARLAHWRGDADDKAFWNVLGAYQNPDGGWAHGVDPDYAGPVSSIQSTIEALRIIAAHQQGDNPNVARTVQFLKSQMLQDGTWQELSEVIQHGAPDWYAPAQYRLWETGCIAGYCLALGYTELWSSAVRYARDVWPQLPPAEVPHPYWATLLLLGRSNHDKDRQVAARCVDEIGRFVRRERLDTYDCSWVVEVLTLIEPPGYEDLLPQLGDFLAVHQGSDGGVLTEYGDHLRPRATFNALMAVALMQHRG